MYNDGILRFDQSESCSHLDKSKGFSNSLLQKAVGGGGGGGGGEYDLSSRQLPVGSPTFRTTRRTKLSATLPHQWGD